MRSHLDVHGRGMPPGGVQFCRSPEFPARESYPCGPGIFPALPRTEVSRRPDGVNDDANDNNDDDAAGDDGEQEENDREQHDDTPIYVDDDFIDDYYAFQEDPGPRTLLPITTLDVVGFLLASFGVTLAAGGGIGGGGYVINIVDVSLSNSIPVLLLFLLAWS